MTDRIAEIRERWAEATMPPWGVETDEHVHVCTRRFEFSGPLCEIVAEGVTAEDAEAIAHAPDDIAYLLARLSAMTDALDPEGLAEAIADRLSWPSMHWDWRTPAAHKAIADAVRRHVLGEGQN